MYNTIELTDIYKEYEEIKVKYPEAIKDFNQIMDNLGYSPDDSPIHLGKEKDKRQINYMCEDGSAMAVYLFLIPWHNKRSYVFDEFLFPHYYKNPFLEDKMKIHTKHLNYEEKTRVGEVGWEVVYTKQPNEFNLVERKKIIFDVMNQIFECLRDGIYDYKPEPGDILVSRPLGPKIDQGFTPTSMELGTKQRGIVARKFGFGPVYPNELQYARYNENLMLEPL